MLLAPLVLVSDYHVLPSWLHYHHILAIVDFLHHHGTLPRMILCRPSIVVNIDLYLLNAQVKDVGVLKKLLVLHPSSWIRQASSQPSLVLFWHATEAEPHSIIRLLLIDVLLHIGSSKRCIIEIHSLIF